MRLNGVSIRLQTSCALAEKNLTGLLAQGRSGGDKNRCQRHGDGHVQVLITEDGLAHWELRIANRNDITLSQRRGPVNQLAVDVGERTFEVPPKPRRA